MFRTNGSLVAIFTNPAPTTIQAFGWAVAGFGSDRVLISGLQDVNKPAPYYGGVFLFRTNGALLTTFTNPAPSTDGGFGISIGALGTDRVIIGAAYNNTGATAAGGL